MSRTLLLLLLAAPAAAQERTHAVTPDDYLTLAAVTDLAVSPDGKHVAYCEARWDKADDARRADLWVVATDGKSKPSRLTFDRGNDRHPRWSADGKWVYVLANRKREAEKKPPYDGSTQVWRVPPDGGVPRPATTVEGGVTGFDYAAKADALFYSVDATATDEDPFTKLRSQYKLEYGGGSRKVSEVYRLDAQTWRAEKVVAEKRYVRELAATQDGKRLAMITAPDDTVAASEGKSRVDVWDADAGKVSPTDESWRKTAASPYPWLESLAWSPDGNRLAFCAIFDAYPAEVIINDWAAIGRWTATLMPRHGGHVRGYGSPLKWVSFGELALLMEHQGMVTLRFVPLDGRPSTTWSSQVFYGFDFGPDPHSPIILGNAHDRDFPELLTTGSNPGFTRITDLNPQTKTWKVPSVQHFMWKAPDGTNVDGMLELPPGYKKGDKPLPLVVAIHGGPTTSSKFDLEFDPHNGRLYFAARGYAVLCPNYRGSTGYGDKFVTDLIGRENDLDVKDILAGIQHLIQEGIADPDRVGVMGWSNGGYLTNCLITLKDPPVKIRAASSGAGILDTVAEWGFNDEPAYPTVFKKGLPWQTPDVYRRTSPTYGLGNVTTPTLIHVGGHDERCPPGHSRMLYRALREYTKVPTELVVYPGEPHGLTKFSHRRAKMEWDLAWFDKYLGGKKE